MTKVKAIAHKDVRGKELYYLEISNTTTGENVLINVGQKTYETVKKLTIDEPDKTTKK